MAKKNNEVLARVSIQVGGVEASRKHLKTLQDAASNFRTEISQLQQHITSLTKAGAAASAIAPFVDRLNKAKSSLQDTNKLIKAQENAIGKYADVMDNLSSAPLVQLQQGMRSLQANMKQTVSANDVKRYAELRAAYDELLATIEQLNGKAPNVGYVLKNIGEVADKTLSDSIEYMEKLVASTDKTTERGVENLKKWSAELKKLQDEQKKRSERIAEKPTDYSANELRTALQQLQQEGANIKLGDTEALKENEKQIERIKTALSDAQAQAQDSFIDTIIEKSKTGDASVEEMEKALKDLKAQLAKTPPSKRDLIENIKQKIDILQPNLFRTSDALKGVRTQLGKIDTKALKSVPLTNLRTAAEQLKKRMEELPPTVEEFARTSEELKMVKARISELEWAARTTASSFDKALSPLANWVTVYMGFDKLLATVKRAFNTTLQLTDAMSDVRKVTGLTADEVANLTDRIQELDTRVSNQNLMQAATEAGRLGLKAMEDIYAFTKASAITLTALDELDARSITSVMKLNALLGETDRLGVQQAILATASSINELSIASAAAQQPIIDFARRYGGIASQAQISTAEVMALGASIDALGQPVEMSSTALNKFTTAMLTNTRVIAEDTGLSEEYLQQMMRSGKTMEAMIEVLSRLGSMGGLGNITKYIGDMGGEGARMTAVISALATNVGFLRQQVDISNLAFEEGTSVIDEYNLKNENAAALMERIGNRFNEIFANSSTTSSVTLLARQLLNLTMFFTGSSAASKAFRVALTLLAVQLLNASKYMKALNGAVIGGARSIKAFTMQLWASRTKITAFAATLKTSAGWVALFNGAISLAGKGLNALRMALKAFFATNPVGLFLLLGHAIVEIVSYFRSATEETEHFKSASEKATEAMEEENHKLLQLRRRMEELIEKGGSLSEVISTLNRDYSDQLGYTISLAAGQKEVAGAIDLVTAAMQRQIAQQEKANITSNIHEQYREEFTTAQKELKDFLSTETKETGTITAGFSKSLRAAIYKDLATSAINGTAEVGANTQRVIEEYSEAAKQTLLQRGESDWFAQRAYEKGVEFWTNRIKQSEEVKKLAELYTERSEEILTQTEDVEAVIEATEQLVANAQKKQIEVIAEENDLLKKAPAAMTQTDVDALKNVIELQGDLLITLQAGTEEYKQLEDSIQQNKEKQRQALFAWIENPLKDVIKYKEQNGKWVKDLDNMGNPQFVSAEQFVDLTTSQLQSIFKRSTQEHEFLMNEYQTNLEDKELPKYAKMLADTQRKIKETLEARGEEISESDFAISLLSKKGKKGSDETDQEIRRSYSALIEQMSAFFNKRKQLIQQNYKDSALTPVEYEQQLVKNEGEKREALAGLQASLLGQTVDFDMQLYKVDKENFDKVSAYILGAGRNFRRTVEGDLEESRNAILQADIKLQEERRKVMHGNDYQAQVNEEMQAAFEKANLFWGTTTEREVQLATKRVEALREIAADAYRLTEQELLDRLAQQEGFGDAFQNLTAEQNQVLLNLIRQFHDKVIQADKKFADERRTLTQQMWKATGGEDMYNLAKQAFDAQEKEISERSTAGAFAYPQQEFEAQQKLILNRIALEEWAAQRQLELAIMNGETQEQLAERETDIAKKRQEAQQAIVDNYLERMSELSDITSTYGTMIGEGFAGMLTGQENAGKDLVKNLAIETIQMISEFTKRLVIQQTLGDMTTKIKEKQYQQQTAAAYSAAMTEIGIEAAKMTAIESIAAGNITAQSLAQPDSITTWGGTGMARASLLIGLISLATAAAVGIIDSLFPGAGNDAKAASSKRLATGMKTYAEGRYPVQGDDGRVYNAQYHPSVQTGVYNGGQNGKAHMAIFSEVMPEMVVSGRTTKIISQNYPSIMEAIMAIDKYGFIPNRRVRTYADGNIAKSYRHHLAGTSATEQTDTLERLNDAINMLAAYLHNPVPSQINMYGTGGIKEASQRADDFYTRHRIRKK